MCRASEFRQSMQVVIPFVSFLISSQASESDTTEFVEVNINDLFFIELEIIAVETVVNDEEYEVVKYELDLSSSDVYLIRSIKQ